MLGSSYLKVNRITRKIMSKAFFTVVLMLSISNVFSMRGKSVYFLQRPAFEGDPPELGVVYEDPMLVDSSAAHKVLFGHYSAILEDRHRQPEAQTKLSLSLDSQKKSQLSKIVEMYRKNFFLTIKRAVDITKGSKSSYFSSQLESCKDDLQKCDKLDDFEIRCGVKCLVRGNELFSVLTNTITTLVDQFCKPINTLFDKMFEASKLKHPILRKFWVFLKRFGESRKSWSNLGIQGAASLVPVIIDKIRTDMMPYRLFDNKLEIVLQAEELLQPPIPKAGPKIANNLCTNVSDASIAADLLDILYRNPVLVDAILGGLTSLNLVSKYVPGRFQVPFAASAEAIRIMTGSICGLVEYAATGNIPSCDQFGGFPVAGIPLPEIPDMPNLNQECLENTGDNEGEHPNENAEQEKNPFRLPDSKAPSSGRHKRDVNTLEKVSEAGRDGASDNPQIGQLEGNGFRIHGRRKRSLIVGQTFN